MHVFQRYFCGDDFFGNMRQEQCLFYTKSDVICIIKLAKHKCRKNTETEHKHWARVLIYELRVFGVSDNWRYPFEYSPSHAFPALRRASRAGRAPSVATKRRATRGRRPLPPFPSCPWWLRHQRKFGKKREIFRKIISGFWRKFPDFQDFQNFRIRKKLSRLRRYAAGLNVFERSSSSPSRPFSPNY